MGNHDHTKVCSFCKKTLREVAQLIAGPDVSICNECIGLCVDILNETTRGAAGDSRTSKQE